MAAHKDLEKCLALKLNEFVDLKYPSRANLSFEETQNGWQLSSWKKKHCKIFRQKIIRPEAGPSFIRVTLVWGA